ncbi:MAG: PAS domain S-box protein [Bacteroidota bacterium]
MNIFSRFLETAPTRPHILMIVGSGLIAEILRSIIHVMLPLNDPYISITFDIILFTVIVLLIIFFMFGRRDSDLMFDYKNTEEALRESENNYKTLMNSGLALVWLAGTDKLCSYFNHVWLEFTGRSLEQEMGNGWVEGVHPDDVARCMKIYIEAFDRRESFNMEYRLRRYDGEYRWIIDQGTPRYDSKGDFKGYIGHCIDITDRRHADELLKERENTLREIIGDVQVGILLQGPHAEILMNNPKALELLGISETQLLGKSSFDPDWNVIHEDGTPFPGETHPVPQVIASRQPVRHVVMGVYRPVTGDRVWLLVDAIPQFDAAGTLRQVVCSFVDITGRKHAEELMRSSAEKFKTLFENMTEGVALHEMIYQGETPVDYRILDTNPAYERHTGLPRTKARGLLASELYGTGTPPYFDEFAAVAFNRIPYSFETYFPPLERHFHISVFSPEKGYFATVFEDITEQKKMFEQLQIAANDLKRSNIELEQFAYIASHDLQEPLRMISSYTQLLEKRYKDKLDQDANDFIGFIVDGADRMKKMIQSFLVYSRTTREKSPMQQVDCNTVLENARMNLQMIIQETGTVITSDTLPAVVGNPELLLQLFQNLISNAIKFQKGKPPVITIGIRKDETHWIFSVKDNGIGIEPEYFEKIFVVFQRLHSQSEYPGTGIGLTICQTIVERHNGTIWVESQPGEGTTFYFTLSSHLKA